ncbi:MAG TPA: protein-methionine-sulfoxide reductase heme-binding subunit MsrQ [Candidatus Dormibacteraeota bacterium]|nr:protein-methionine-sulfoxide reductase heme-binding subunit MsrQ [Candidatus Dormibacteraeota bacterium]
MVKNILTSRWAKVAIFVLCLGPAARLVWRALHAGLGANPIEFITHETGDWILIFLVLTLAITPLRRVLQVPELIRFRRMLGLFAFFYACLHFSTWIGLDKFFDFREMLNDVAKRRFITVGFIGFALMIPLALTSTAGAIRRLGGKRWRMLHRLIYVSAAAGVVHYYWLVKSDVRKPVRYALLVGLLLAYRVCLWLIDKRRGAAVRGTPMPGRVARQSTSEVITPHV